LEGGGRLRLRRGSCQVELARGFQMRKFEFFGICGVL
jgi:hypothetical protein